MYYQNVRGLNSKTHLEYNNSALLKSEYDLIAFTETWLRPDIHSAELFDLNNFNVFRS